VQALTGVKNDGIADNYDNSIKIANQMLEAAQDT
jgi:hypothetical protein